MVCYNITKKTFDTIFTKRRITGLDVHLVPSPVLIQQKEPKEASKNTVNPHERTLKLAERFSRDNNVFGFSYDEFDGFCREA